MLHAKLYPQARAIPVTDEVRYRDSDGTCSCASAPWKGSAHDGLRSATAGEDRGRSGAVLAE
ncbi:MAG: hypothetical protein ACLSAF_05435 [Intestinimonas sp.]